MDRTRSLLVWPCLLVLAGASAQVPSTDRGGGDATRPAASRPVPAVPGVVVDLWPGGKMPGVPATQPETDRFDRGDRVHRVTNVSTPTLEYFRSPVAVPGRAMPAVLVCPGGGYGYVVYDKEGTEIAAWLNSLGIHAVVLKYRVPNNRAGAFQDVQRALRVVRGRAAEWGIDPARVGVMGFSAGGHLSARASTGAGQKSYEPVDETDAASCRPDFTVLVYPAYLGRDGKVAEELEVRADLPPTLIVHSEDDVKYIEGSRIYSAALREAKAPFEFLLYKTGGHGFALRGNREARVWPEAAAAWLGKIGVLRSTDAAGGR